MARPTQRQTCRECGRHKDEVGQMSWTGKCGECGQAALHENIYGLVNLTDQSYDAPNGRMVRERWRRGIAAGIGLSLDDVQARD